MKHLLSPHRLRMPRNMAQILAATIAILMSYPVLAFCAGNIFFGEVKPLYNLTFAKVFYEIATHPPLERMTPRSAHYQLARTHFIEGDIFRSLEETKKELALYPDNYVAHYLTGLDYGYLDMPYEGIAAFDKYIANNPVSWAGRNDKAWLQFRVGDIDGALATVEPVLQFYPLTPWVQNTYCSLLLNTARRREAQEVCEHAKELILKMTPEDWGHAYPGNDPSIYSQGLAAMQKAAEENAVLAKKMRGK